MHALRSYLKLICEDELHCLPNKKVSGAKDTTSRSDRPLSAIFYVIVSLSTNKLHIITSSSNPSCRAFSQTDWSIIGAIQCYSASEIQLLKMHTHQNYITILGKTLYIDRNVPEKLFTLIDRLCQAVVP